MAEYIIKAELIADKIKKQNGTKDQFLMANGDVTSKSDIEFTYTNDKAMPAAVGGLTKGTTFENMSLNDLLGGLLYPYVKFSWYVSTTPATFEYGTNPGSIEFEAHVTKGSEDYTIKHGETSSNGTYTFTPSSTLTVEQKYDFTVSDGTNSETKTAMSNVGYYVDLFYSSTALDSLDITTNSSTDKLYTSNPQNITISASTTTKQYLYFVCPTSWWTDGKTLSSSVGAVNAASTKTATRHTCSYTIAYLGQFDSGSSYIINKA